jgi:hypothetical protein
MEADQPQWRSCLTETTKLNTFELICNTSLMYMHSRNYSIFSQILIPITMLLPGYNRLPLRYVTL